MPADERDPRYHTGRMKQRLNDTIDHLREDIEQVDEVDLDTLARNVRPIYPETSVTGDYRASRVNLDLTADGVILRVWCG